MHYLLLGLIMMQGIVVNSSILLCWPLFVVCQKHQRQFRVVECVSM